MKAFAIALYFVFLFLVALFTRRKQFSSTDFIIGGRSLNYWLTALAAHASDMSGWLFMAYPAAIFIGGLFNAWAAIGLIVFMFLNWHFIAKRIRLITEKYSSLTFSSYFESRFSDTSGLIRIFTALMSFVFYTIYISASLMALGLLTETLFGIDYAWSIFLGILVVCPYVLIGGYVTLAWLDLIQGLFLLTVIFITPIYLLPYVGGMEGMLKIIQAKHLSLSFFPDFSFKTFLSILFLGAGWGLGYFGQPHIVTKFMGIKVTENMNKSKYIGMTWMILSLGCATFIGLLAIAYFPKGFEHPQLIFIEMVTGHFSPFLTGLVLCAVLAATVSVIDSQILILGSNISEDFYKKIFRKKATSKELLLVSRLGILVMGAIAYFIAYLKLNTIWELVFYAWSGLGCSFGPILIFSLYSKRVNKYGAWAGILTGGIVSGIWPLINKATGFEIPSMIPGFTLSSLSIWIVSTCSSTERSIESIELEE